MEQIIAFGFECNGCLGLIKVVKSPPNMHPDPRFGELQRLVPQKVDW
jgi:hypothetical protein